MMKYGEFRAGWKQESCQLKIDMIKPKLSLQGFFFIMLTGVKYISPSDLCRDPSFFATLK